MKKYVFLGFLHFILITSLKAQQWNIRYGIDLHVSAPTYGISNVTPGTSRQADKTYGLGLSGMIEASKWRLLAIQSGLTLQSLGAKLQYSEFGKTTVTQHTYWAQIPLNIVFRLPFPRKSGHDLFISSGPYAGLGLFGSNSFLSNYEGIPTDFHFGNQGSQKRFDYGLQASFGYQIKRKYKLSVGYLDGLADLSTSSRYEQRNRAWSASLGYSF